MWSKQNATPADPRAKNMTFKNKISNKKQKTFGVNAIEPNDNAADNKVNENKKKQQQQTTTQKGKNKGRNRNKKDATKALDKNAEKNVQTTESNASKKDEGKSKQTPEESLDDCDGVVLRNGVNRAPDVAVKRYSDSFVIENDATEESKASSNPTPLTRALSGFFVLDQTKKANRRFSDLFRPASAKLSGSTESLKVSMKLEKNVDDKKEKKNASDTAKNKNNQKNENAKKNVKGKLQETGKASITDTSQSYLKRVKSRIYKSKSDDSSKIELDNKYKKLKPKKSLDLNNRIPEEEVPSTPSPVPGSIGGIQKSLGHFHFGRLTRQTTNLERISRPFGSQKSVESFAQPKPVLAKAKSSSAINLSLLRSRRAKMMEQGCASASATCRDEFDFIAFGDVHSGSTTSLNRFPSWLYINKGEAKVSQPVTRKGSDRKTERGCEEAEGEAQGAADKNDDAQMPVERSDSGAQSESSNISQSSGAKKRNTSHINRSESVKEQPEKNRKQQQRRNVSDPSHSFNTSPEADVERQALSKNADSGSSSNSNISCNYSGRLSESPSNSMDVHQATVRTQSDTDSDMDGETDPLNWQELVTEEELKKLNPNEKKRQEVINELILTEVSHVRMLKVLYKLFYKTLYNSQILKPDELNLLFPNIKELLDVHSEINKEMRRIRKEDPLVRQIGDVLLATFTGNQGEALQKASATFCERQQLALEFIKRRRERDSKFDAVLTECEKSRQCRRLQLQGIIPVEMQRLTRYSLLLERLVKSVEAAEKVCSDYQDELVKLKQVHQRSKEVLSHVNDAAKLALNKHRLDEIQRHLDVSNFRASDHPIVHDFKNIDLTRYKLILEGNLQLRRPNKALVPVHILLLEEMVVLLQKENDKFILKFFQSGIPGQPALSPIIKMSTLLVRENAVCKNALFLVNTSTTTNVCMYDLQAEDESKRETWRKNFSDAAESYNRREGKLNRGSTITTSSQETASDSDTNSIRDLSTEGEVPEPPPPESTPPSPATESPEQPPKTTEPLDSPSPSEDPAGDQTPDVTPGGGIQLTTKVSAEDWPLIQPSQVNVVVPPVHTAESMLTPLEQIRRKDALVKQALAEKENLVADLLSIPREHFEHIADMAASTSDISMSGASDITDRLLASVFQVDLLQKAVNDAFNITEGEVVAAKGGKKPACASQEPQYANEAKPNVPSIPASQLRDIVTSLSSQLTTLLSEVKLVEEERDRLRKELHKMKEKLHEEHNLHSPVPFDDAASDGSAQEVFCEASSDEPK